MAGVRDIDFLTLTRIVAMNGHLFVNLENIVYANNLQAGNFAIVQGRALITNPWLH